MKRINLDKWIQKQLLKLPTEVIRFRSTEAEHQFANRMQQLTKDTIDLMVTQSAVTYCLIEVLIPIYTFTADQLEGIVRDPNIVYHLIHYKDKVAIKQLLPLVKKLYTVEGIVGFRHNVDEWIKFIVEVEKPGSFQGYMHKHAFQETIARHKECPDDILLYIFNARRDIERMYDMDAIIKQRGFKMVAGT